MCDFSTLHGHLVKKVNGKFYFADTGESTVLTWKNRPCGHCGEYRTKEGHDACLGVLEGVMNACCGHGCTDSASIQFVDGSMLFGQEAINTFKIL